LVVAGHGAAAVMGCINKVRALGRKRGALTDKYPYQGEMRNSACSMH